MNPNKEPQLFIASIELTGLLGDVVFLLGLAAFFALCVGLVKFCDHIVGGDVAVAPGAAAPTIDGDAPTDREVAA